MKPKEVFRDGLRIKSAGHNCLVSVATCALHELGKADWDADMLRSLLRSTNHYCLKLVTRCLEVQTGIKFEEKIVLKNRSAVSDVLTEKLDQGSLCELRVGSHDWIGSILNCDPHGIKNGLHSVMVFGYYDPRGRKQDLWLYVADSYSQRLLFLPYERVHGVLEKRVFASIGIFSSFRKENGGYGWWDKLWLDGDDQGQLEKVVAAQDKLIHFEKTRQERG